MCHGGDICKEGGGAEIVKTCRLGLFCNFEDHRFQTSQHLLAVALAKRHHPHGDGNQIGRESMQETVKRGIHRQAVSRSCKAT